MRPSPCLLLLEMGKRAEFSYPNHTSVLLLLDILVQYLSLAMPLLCSTNQLTHIVTFSTLLFVLIKQIKQQSI